MGAVTVTAVAALIGAVVGASASITAALLTQRATDRRDRERRMWDRRVDTYDDMMATIHRFARMRAHAERTGRLPESRGRRDEARGSAQLLTARIEIYSSEKLRGACEKAFAEIQNWMRAWEAWHERDVGLRLQSDKDAKWQVFLQCVRDSKEADRALLDLVHIDVHGKKRKSVENSSEDNALP